MGYSYLCKCVQGGSLRGFAHHPASWWFPYYAIYGHFLIFKKGQGSARGGWGLPRSPAPPAITDRGPLRSAS